LIERKKIGNEIIVEPGCTKGLLWQFNQQLHSIGFQGNILKVYSNIMLCLNPYKNTLENIFPHTLFEALQDSSLFLLVGENYYGRVTLPNYTFVVAIDEGTFKR